MTVIAFVPGYDTCTRNNQLLANQLPAFKHGKNIVHGKSATRDQFWRIVDSKQAIFVMSHGDAHLVCAQGGFDNAVDFDDVASNLQNVRERNVFAWACRTSKVLGQTFRGTGPSIHRGIWWGYPVAVSAPDRRLHNNFVLLFSFVVEHFPFVDSHADALAFKRDLKKLCEPIYQQLVLDVARSKKYAGLHESAVVFREIHEYLEISFAGGTRIPPDALPLAAMGF